MANRLELHQALQGLGYTPHVSLAYW